MNQRLIDHYLAEKSHTPDEIEDYKQKVVSGELTVPTYNG